MRCTALCDAEQRVLPVRRCGEWFALAVALTCLVTAQAHAGNKCPGEGCVRVRPQDEVLLVNSRPLCCRTEQQQFATSMTALQYVADEASDHRHWQSLPLHHALATVEPTTPTIIFAHGNRVEPSEVRSRGLWVYSRLVKCAGDQRPFRFVIFSWPSSQIKGLIRDAREKAARTRPAGLHLAWTLSQLSPEAPIGLLGYSYGARVISGATHLLAGGTLGGLSLEGCGCDPRRPLRAVYLAAAFDASWLGPGRYHGRSMEQIEQLLTATNQRDPAMKLYPLVSPRHDPAFGFKGPTCLTRETSRRVRLMNLTSAVGATHDMCEYMAVGGFMANAWRRLTFADAMPTELARAHAPATGRK